MCYCDAQFCVVRSLESHEHSKCYWVKVDLYSRDLQKALSFFHLVFFSEECKIFGVVFLYTNYIWICVMLLINTETFPKYSFSDGMGYGRIYIISIYSLTRMSVLRVRGRRRRRAIKSPETCPFRISESSVLQDESPLLIPLCLLLPYPCTFSPLLQWLPFCPAGLTLPLGLI